MEARTVMILEAYVIDHATVMPIPSLWLCTMTQ